MAVVPPPAPPCANTQKLIYAALVGLCGSANLAIGLGFWRDDPPASWITAGFVLCGVFQKVAAIGIYRDAKHGR